MTRSTGKTQTKKGHPSNLALLSREDWLADPIDWTDLPDLNDPLWYEKVSNFFENIRYPRKNYDLGLSPAASGHVEDTMKRLAATPAAKFFIGTNKEPAAVPNLTLSGARRLRAIEISRNLLDITRRDPKLVRYVATGYCWAANGSMRIYLKDQQEAEFGKDLILLVRELELNYRLVYFVAEDESPTSDAQEEPINSETEMEPTAAEKWQEWLGLEDPAKVEREGVRDPGNLAELGHLGIDVMIPGRNRKSREFHELMLAAAAAELWRCVAPRPMPYQEFLDLESVRDNPCSMCPHFRRPALPA